jgi:hypothetical protein
MSKGRMIMTKAMRDAIEKYTKKGTEQSYPTRSKEEESKVKETLKKKVKKGTPELKKNKKGGSVWARKTARRGRTM